MIKLYFLLFYEFFKIGIFAIGGGYATLPFLYYIQSIHNWFSVDELTNMIAISNITPGPIGINMATYVGYTTTGVFGSILATTAIVLGPFVMVVFISKLFNKFKSYKFVQDIFLGLRPASCALLVSIGLELLYKQIFVNNKYDLKAIELFIIMIIPFSFMKKNPLIAIIIGAVGGIILQNI
jgi:chromate transporter